MGSDQPSSRSKGLENGKSIGVHSCPSVVSLLRSRTFLIAATVTLAAHAFAAWPMRVIDDKPKGPDGVKLADANGDGLPDIATGFEQGGVTRIYLHPGHAKVREPWPKITVGKSPDAEDAMLMDLDGDGAMDVVSCCEGRTKTVFVNWAPHDKSQYFDPKAWTCEAFPALQGKAMWMFCLPLQIDGKNGIDLVIGSKDGAKRGDLKAPFGWLESPANPRDLAAWTWHPLIDVGWTMGIEAADMDGDGDSDIVLTDRYGNLTGCKWLENEGKILSVGSRPLGEIVWKKHDIGAIGENCMFFALADLDADGLQDASVITMANKLHIVRRLNREGTKWEDHDVPLPTEILGSGKGVAAGDIDLDGRLDLVLSFEHSEAPKHSLIWLSHEGSPFSGKWTWHELSGVNGVKNDQVRLADLDGDGDLDALTTEEVTNLGVIWYENPIKQTR